MNKSKKLYKRLIEDGYDEDFAQLCVDSMVEKDEFIGTIIGFFEDLYFTQMSEVENASDDFKDFISESLCESYSYLSPTFSSDTFIGYNALDLSTIAHTGFAIDGGVWFVIFDNEEDCASLDEKVFHDVFDFLIWNDEEKKYIQKEIEKFDWRPKNNVSEEVLTLDGDAPLETKEIPSNDAYNVAIKWLRENDTNNEHYNNISLLVKQYYYGIEPKKELEVYLKKINAKVG